MSHADIRFVTASLVLAVLTGCGEPRIHYDVQINRRVDQSTVQSLAVLEFGWTTPGALKAQRRQEQRRLAEEREQRKEERERQARLETARRKAEKAGEDPTTVEIEEPTEYKSKDRDDDDDDYEDDDDKLPHYIRRAGMTISDQVGVGLLGTGAYSVCERNRLQTLLAEHDLTASGIVRERRFGQAAQLLGVDALVIGEVTKFSERMRFVNISFNCRCINGQGVVMWSMEGSAEFLAVNAPPIQASRELINRMMAELARKLEETHLNTE